MRGATPQPRSPGCGRIPGAWFVPALEGREGDPARSLLARGRVGGRLAETGQKQAFPLPARGTALGPRYTRLPKGDGLVCIIARSRFFLNKNLNSYNRPLIIDADTVRVEAPRLISAAIDVHHLGVKLKARRLPLVFVASPPSLRQICAVMFQQITVIVCTL